MTKNERICLIRKAVDMSCEKFGSMIGVSKGTVSNIENGKTIITPRMEKIICREFDVNPYWFETGEGEMFIKPSFEDMDFADELLKPKNKMYLELFKACKKTFTQEDWDDIKRIIEKSYQIVQELESGNEETPQE